MKRKSVTENGADSKKSKELDTKEDKSDSEESENGAWASSNEGESGDDIEEAGDVEEGDGCVKKPAIGVQMPLDKERDVRKASLYKQPTSQELNTLRETETLFHSNLFRLQAEELVTEIRVAKRASFMNWVDELTKFLTNIPCGDPVDLNDRDWMSSMGLHLPLDTCPPNKGKFRFATPANVSLVASFPLRLLLKQSKVVDLAVEMPKEVFRNDDCINHKYHIKRAMYCAVLAHKLSKCQIVEQVKFSFAQNDRLRPILLIKPNKSASKILTIAILLHPPDKLFHLQRLCPNLCNVQPSWFFQDNKMNKDIRTPHYNSSVLVDLHMKANAQFVAENLPDSKGVRDGILLLKLWAHQRHLSTDLGGFSSFILTMYVTYLVRTKKVRELMSSYQIARTTWLCLANSDWTKAGITLASKMELRQPTLEMFHECFDVVFIDPSGYLNLCANMLKTTFFRVQHEARLAVQFLDDTSRDSFDSLFLSGLTFSQKFDHLVVINQLDSLQIAAKTLNLRNELLDTNNNLARAITPKLVDLLENGLSKRIHMLDVELDSAPIWDIGSAPPTASKISVGLLLDPEFSSSLLDKGPSPDSEQAAQFIKFWGQRSEIRRFQDGSICETVVWPGSTLADKRIVCKHVVNHILMSHLGIGGEGVHYMGDTIDGLISLQLDSASANTFSTGEEQAIAILKVYDDLRKKLRKLRDLALDITSVQGISPVFRHAQVFPQPSYKKISRKDEALEENHQVLVCQETCPPWIDPLEVILKLETSGKWPDDYEAVRRLIAAFYIQLSGNLRTQFHLTAAAYPTHVLVLSGGYVFKLIVASHKEVNCMKTKMLPSGATKVVETDATRALELRLKILPRVSGALHGLQMQQSTYSATCRLAKRWVACQLLTDHVSDIGIELMVAHVYLHPSPFTEPRSPQVGFLRFLRLLCSFDWKTAPLIVNFNDELKKDDFSTIQTKFSATRPDLPAMFIATPNDTLTSLWTRDKPNPVILHRLITLAHEAKKIFESQLSNPDPTFACKTIFRPCLDVFDVIIHLRPSQIPSDGLQVERNRRRWDKFDMNGREATSFPVVDYNPVTRYLKDLQESFDDFALFFYDHYGGKYIAVLWKPRAFESQTFKVSQVANHMVTSNTHLGPMMAINHLAVVEDFTNMGAGLVNCVESKTERWDR